MSSSKPRTFTCYRCGASQDGYNVIGVGDREYCRYPDHTPRFRIYFYGRLRIWLKSFLPRSYWGA